jgi:hypothetical protein
MTPRAENLTMTGAELAACQPIAGEGGHGLRALCPFHGSDHQRSLRVTVATGRFVCFACGAWGYMAEARERWHEERQRQAGRGRIPPRQQPTPLPGARRPAAAGTRGARPAVPRDPAPARPNLAQQLAAFQAALPGSRGATYLQQRGIPLALAQQYGVGYAVSGTWPHPARDWRGGRVVCPHTTLDEYGALVHIKITGCGDDSP